MVHNQLQVHSVISDDDVIKDSETEGSEMPLGELMKLLKTKAKKAKKEEKNKLAEAGVANENDFDILKMVKEIDSDNVGKKRSDHELQKNKIFVSETTDVPVPKRRRSSAQAHKSPLLVDTEGSKRSAKMNQENNFKFEKKDDEPHSGSEDEHMQEKIVEPEFKFLSSRIRKKSSTYSKQKGKRSKRDHGEALNDSAEAKVCFSANKIMESMYFFS